MIPEVAEVSANYNVPYTPPIMEYRQQTIKTTVTVNGEYQSEIVYTYDKYGRLVTTVVRSHLIGEI
jgi:hypothetical protein